jgi:hypothetical protein
VSTSNPGHWDTAFSQDITSRGWYQAAADTSWAMLADVPPTASLLDVGAGASVLVDEALARGFTDLTVLDWSPVALGVARDRLGSRCVGVHWVVADVTDWQPTRTYDVWHDRAVLHFLLSEPQRVGYHRTLLAATHPGSLAVIGVFAPTGPPVCAGLPVQRYSVTDLAAFLGPQFHVESTDRTPHRRPDGDLQDYTWVRARRTQA